MTERVRADAIEIDFRLHDFVRHEAAPGTGVDPAAFWRGFAALVRRLAPRNAALLARRDTLQAQIDDWHRQHPGALFDPASYRAFLRRDRLPAAGTRRLLPSAPRTWMRKSRASRVRNWWFPSPTRVMP